VQYDCIAKNIITSALNLDEFFRVSQCSSAKEKWDVLEVTHEGTNDVKRARKHALIQEYELFRMQPGEAIADVQKQFIHIVNHLIGLRKQFDKEELNIKILKCLDRSWQPKVTAISETRGLTTLTTAALFGKLREHELEMTRLKEMESTEKKSISLALKSKAAEIETSEDSTEDDSETENLNLLTRRFQKFIKLKSISKNQQSKRYNKKFDFFSAKLTCFGCGKQGHIKADCPNLSDKEKPIERKSYKAGKTRKAYIAWEDNASTSNNLSQEDVEANLCLIAGEDSEVCLASSKLMWYLDSGCSKHMTEDSTQLINTKWKSTGYVTYGDNNRGKILGVGDIGGNDRVIIKDVLLVKGLKHNLLITFKPAQCLITDSKSAETVLVGKRVSNIYMLNVSCISSSMNCLLSRDDESWSWYRRLAHIHMHHSNKIASKDLVIGLPKLKFERKKLCQACQRGKQTKSTFKPINVVSTSRPLEMLHLIYLVLLEQ